MTVQRSGRQNTSTHSRNGDCIGARRQNISVPSLYLLKTINLSTGQVRLLFWFDEPPENIELINRSGTSSLLIRCISWKHSTYRQAKYVFSSDSLYLLKTFNLSTGQVRLLFWYRQGYPQYVSYASKSYHNQDNINWLRGRPQYVLKPWRSSIYLRLHFALFSAWVIFFDIQ
jgi:hypothetical protein